MEMDPDASQLAASELDREQYRLAGLIGKALETQGFVVVAGIREPHDLLILPEVRYWEYTSPEDAGGRPSLDVRATDGSRVDTVEVFVTRDSVHQGDVSSTLAAEAVGALGRSDPVRNHALRNRARGSTAASAGPTADDVEGRFSFGEPTGMADPRHASIKRIAIPAIDGEGLTANQRSVLSDLILTQAASFSDLTVISPAEINAVLDLERQKDLLGCDEDPACIADIAGAFRVDGILLSAIGEFGETHVLTLKLVDVRDVRVVLRSTSKATADAESLLPLVETAVPRLLSRVARK